MDLIKLKHKKLDQAIKTFEEVVKRDLNDDIIRDSAIQRFEYCIEILWKTLKTYLEVFHEIEASSPKNTIRESLGQKILTPEEAEETMEMLQFRNHTSHDYAIEIANRIRHRLPQYAKTMRKICAKMAGEIELL